MPSWIKKSHLGEILTDVFNQPLGDDDYSYRIGVSSPTFFYQPNLNRISPANIVEFSVHFGFRRRLGGKKEISFDFGLCTQEQMLQPVLAKLRSFAELAQYNPHIAYGTMIGINGCMQDRQDILLLLTLLKEIEPTFDSEVILELIRGLCITDLPGLALYDKKPSTAVKDAIKLDIKNSSCTTCYNLVMYIFIKFDYNLAKLGVENLSYDKAMSIAERLDKYLSHLDILFDSLNRHSIHSAIEKILPCIMHAKNLIQDYGLEFQRYDMNKLNKFHLRLLMGEPNKWQSEINNLSAELAGLSLGDHSLGEIKIDAKTIITLLEVIADQQKKAENLQKKVPASRDTLVAYKNQASKDITTDNEEKDLTKSQILKQDAARERRKSF